MRLHDLYSYVYVFKHYFPQQCKVLEEFLNKEVCTLNDFVNWFREVLSRRSVLSIENLVEWCNLIYVANFKKPRAVIEVLQRLVGQYGDFELRKVGDEFELRCMNLKVYTFNVQDVSNLSVTFVKNVDQELYTGFKYGEHDVKYVQLKVFLKIPQYGSRTWVVKVSESECGLDAVFKHCVAGLEKPVDIRIKSSNIDLLKVQEVIPLRQLVEVFAKVDVNDEDTYMKLLSEIDSILRKFFENL